MHGEICQNCGQTHHTLICLKKPEPQQQIYFGLTEEAENFIPPEEDYDVANYHFFNTDHGIPPDINDTAKPPETTTGELDPEEVHQHFSICREMNDFGHNNILNVGEFNILNTNNYFNNLESLDEEDIPETCIAAL